MRFLDALVAPAIKQTLAQIARFIGDLHLRLDARERDLDAKLDTLLSAVNSMGRSSFIEGRGFRAVAVNGVQVVVNPLEEEFGRTIAAHGHWEPTIASLITRALSPGDVFVDIGANVGVMTLQAASRVGPEGRVVSFEPNPDNLDCLLRGIVLNDVRNVTVYPVGLSDRREVFSLVGGSNTYLMPPGASERRTLTLPGDDLLADEPRIDLIKIDVEGHEPFVLAGLDRTLRARLPAILCEFNPRCLKDHVGCDPEDFAAQLFELTSRLEAVEHDGASTIVEDPSSLLRFWAECNRRAVETNHLPDGMVHLDLLLRVEARSPSLTASVSRPAPPPPAP